MVAVADHKTETVPQTEQNFHHGSGKTTEAGWQCGWRRGHTKRNFRDSTVLQSG